VLTRNEKGAMRGEGEEGSEVGNKIFSQILVKNK